MSQTAEPNESTPREPTAPTAESTGAAATATRPAPAPARPAVLPEWRVLLHNDDRNEMGYVVDMVVRIARLNLPAATRCMVEAHRKGLSLVTVTHRERAELLQEQFRSCSLTVTIEPVA